MIGAGGVLQKAPFSLPTGISEGRPDLSYLLQAREPHERLIREGALERRAAAEAVRDEYRVRARTAPSSPRAQRDQLQGSSPGSDVSPAKFGLGTLGFVPPGMVASGTLNAIAAGMAGPLGDQLEPNRYAKPPTPVGMYASRPRTLEGRRPDLQALRQHDLGRSERAAKLALASSGAWEAAVGGWEGGGWGSGGPAHGSTLGDESVQEGRAGSPLSQQHLLGRGEGSSSSPLPFPEGGSIAGSTGGGGGRLVRVGVAVEDVLREGRATGGGGSGSGSGGGGGGEWPSSRRPLPSPLHPRSPFGSIRKPAELEEAARKMPQFARPARDQFFVPNADQDYAISTSHPVAFRQAVKDLPAAAITAVREMLLDKQSLTVSRVHQRRPPYLDVGPRVVGWAAVQRELQPSEFKGTLRRQPEDTMAAVRRKPFSLGATAPWNKSKHTLSGMDTFDFMAKQSAVRYYVTDFTEPTGPPMRPASRGPTRFASNVPSMLERDAEVLKARETNKLLTRVSQPHDQEDHTYNFSHFQERHVSNPPLQAPGDRLVPYANTPLLPPSPRNVPPVSQSSSYRVYGTPRL